MEIKKTPVRVFFFAKKKATPADLNNCGSLVILRVSHECSFSEGVTALR